MTTTPEQVVTTDPTPSYSERMETFPDINEELEKYTEDAKQVEAQRYFKRYLAMMNALTMGRTNHVRVNSWNRPEPHRADGSPMTKKSREARAEISHRRSKAARRARVTSR
jgi:hypothetical protein